MVYTRLSGATWLLLLSLIALLALPLAASAHEDSIFVSVRVYSGVDPADQAEIARLVDEGFLPIMRESDGFVGYYLLPAEDTLAAISLFDSAEQAAASNDAARSFVAENLAPFLPNPPTIVEGQIGVIYVAEQDQMMAGDGMPLYASLRIYKVDNLQGSAESNRLVEAHLLPALVDAGGLHSYFSLNDGVDTVVGLYVYNSAPSALAANDIAADFVSEHLMDWLPDDPLRINGPLGVAALADVDMGANQVQQKTHDASAFASVRVYEGVDPADMDAIIQITADGFLPIMSDSDGFIAYFLLPEGDMLAAISAFETEEQAAASNDAARSFVAENLAPLLPNLPTIVKGPMDTGFFARLDEPMMMDATSLFASLRIYAEVDLTQHSQTTAIVHSGFLPILQEAEGFWAYVRLHDGESRSVALSIYDNEANALAANEKAAAFVAENLTDRPDLVPLRVSGRLGVAALADVDMGANLVEDVPMDDSVFVSVRVYDGVDPADQAEIARLVDDGFLPIMRESDGFVGYYLLPAEDMLAAISLFDSAEQAAASNDKARDFVAEKLAPFLPNAPTIVEGQIGVIYVAEQDQMMAGDGMPLYASLRIYKVDNLQGSAESNRLVEAHLLPALVDAGGLHSYFSLNDGLDTVVGLYVYNSAPSALAAVDIVADFVSEYMMDSLPEDPLRINGSLGVAALAEVDMGANQVQQKTHDASAFASVRVYEGVDPTDMDAIIQITADGFLPIMSGSDGFIAYFLLPEGDTLAAISAFETAEQAAASNDAARSFVAENLAPLLPNSPTIVKGPMDTGFFARLDEPMMMMDATSLFASLRIYAEVNLTRRAQTTAIVHSGFLPTLQEAEGFWAYVRLHDGESHSVALSIYDNEANALAANEKAAAFVAENLGDRSDLEPLRVSGQLGVAALADVDMGANLVEYEAMDDSVFASVRLYDGIDPADQDNIASLTAEGFLPIIRESDGFVGYYFLTADDRLATVSLFDSPEQASASNEKARDFIAENLAPLLPSAPKIFEGPLSVNIVAAPGDDDELYAGIRFYEGFDLAHFDEANDLAISQLLPALNELGGMLAQFALNDGVDTVVGVSIFNSEEAALAANEVGKAFRAEYLAAWAPNPPSGVAGKLAIAAHAEINMGENLVGAPMEG